MSLKPAIDRGERMRMNSIWKFLPAIVTRKRPEFTQIISYKFRGLQQFVREGDCGALFLMLIECPKPCPKPIKLEVRPVALFSICSIKTIARMQYPGFSKCFTRADLSDPYPYQILAFVYTPCHPLMKASSAFVLACQVHGIGNEGTITKPAIVICRKIGACDIAAIC